MPNIHARTGLFIISLGVLTACQNINTVATTAKTDMQSARQSAMTHLEKNKPSVTQGVIDDLSVRMREVQIKDPQRTLELSANQTTLLSLVEGLANQEGYSVSAVEGVDTSRRINTHIVGMTVMEAIRHVAFQAGVIAVVQPESRHIVLADQASFTYKLPPHLLRSMSANYSVGGDPVGGGGGSGGAGGGAGGGMTGGGSGGGSPIKSEFIITGRHDTNQGALINFITQIAGSNASVQVFSEQGLVMVRGNAQSLKRVSEFMQNYVQSALRQVEISASVVEVVVNDEFRFGIKWDRVLQGDFQGNVGFDNTGVAGAAPALSINVTSSPISGVIKALEKFTHVKVVTTPSLVALNHTPATLFDGQRIPYLPSLSLQTSGSPPVNTKTGTTAYALDGINISVTADILDANTVHLTLIPVTNLVGRMESFLDGELQVPHLSTKQSIMQVLAHSGKTVILGGNRYAASSAETTGLPYLARLTGPARFLSGVQDVEGVREHVILVNTRILPAPAFNPLVSEAL